MEIANSIEGGSYRGTGVGKELILSRNRACSIIWIEDGDAISFSAKGIGGFTIYDIKSAPKTSGGGSILNGNVITIGYSPLLKSGSTYRYAAFG